MTETKHKLRIRNSDGFFDDLQYEYNDDFSINWRKMIKPEHTVINTQRVEEVERVYGKSVSELDIREVDDKYLLVLLPGFKELAHLRGYSSVKYDTTVNSDGSILAKCSIAWIPNAETGGKEVVFESLATASVYNTFDFTQNYLAEMAENRSFCRCVRNFLRINLVGKDEIGPQSPKRNIPVQGEREKKYSPVEPRGVLQNLLKSKKVTFAKFKEGWIKQGNPEASEWMSLDDVPAEQIYVILERIKGKKR